MMLKFNNDNFYSSNIRDLKRYRALLRDAQTMLEQKEKEGGGKAQIRQLKNQVRLNNDKTSFLLVYLCNFERILTYYTSEYHVIFTKTCDFFKMYNR